MDEESRQASPDVADGDRTPEEIQAQINVTREQLGDTVAAVAERVDVKAQAQQRAAEVRQSVQEKKDDLLGKVKRASPQSASTGAQQLTTKAQQNPLPLGIGAALLVGFLIGRRRRR